ncbi:MAG: GNAT family N-acetyltransferase [Actinocatenispora sp.]
MQPGYVVCRASTADIPAIADLVYAVELVGDPTATRYEVDEFRQEWSGLDLAQDVWLVRGPHDEVCGYGTIEWHEDSGRLFADGYTRPDHDGAGIGTELVARMERRGREIVAGTDGIRQVMVNHVILGGAGERLLRARGYTLARVHDRMHIDLVAHPPRPAARPDGVTIRGCDGSRAERGRVHQVVEDSFADHWGRASRTFAQWERHVMYTGFDPSLWLLAESDGDLVGVCVGRARDEGGEINQLGVLRAARGRGIGGALLREAFLIFAERGLPAARLDVDSDSLTRANQLYRRAGMVVTSSIGRFELEVRPGTDRLVEGLSPLP